MAARGGIGDDSLRPRASQGSSDFALNDRIEGQRQKNALWDIRSVVWVTEWLDVTSFSIRLRAFQDAFHKSGKRNTATSLPNHQLPYNAPLIGLAADPANEAGRCKRAGILPRLKPIRPTCLVFRTEACFKLQLGRAGFAG
jgi:hypothetical protein